MSAGLSRWKTGLLTRCLDRRLGKCPRGGVRVHLPPRHIPDGRPAVHQRRQKGRKPEFGAGPAPAHIAERRRCCHPLTLNRRICGPNSLRRGNDRGLPNDSRSPNPTEEITGPRFVCAQPQIGTLHRRWPLPKCPSPKPIGAFHRERGTAIYPVSTFQRSPCAGRSRSRQGQDGTSINRRPDEDILLAVPTPLRGKR